MFWSAFVYGVTAVSFVSTRTVQLYGQLFQRNETTPAAEAGEEVETTAEPPVSTQQQEQQQQEGTVAANSQNEEQQSHEGLVSLVQSSVDSFFGLLYAKVDHSLGVSPTSQPRGRMPSGGGGGATTITSEDQQPQGGAGEGSAAGELDPVALGGVVAAVQQLVSDIEALDPHVPQVRREGSQTWELCAHERGTVDGQKGKGVVVKCGVFAPLLSLAIAPRCNERSVAITMKEEG